MVSRTKGYRTTSGSAQTLTWDHLSLGSPHRGRRERKALIAKGQLDASVGDDPEPLGFLIHESGAQSLTDAAYRFVRHTPGIDVTLFGTGSIGHLEANIASILRPPLPEPDVRRLHELFGHLKGVGLDLPGPPSRG